MVLARFQPNPDFGREISNDAEFQRGIARQLEDTRALADSFAHPIYPRAGHKLVEIQKDDSGIRIVLTSYGGHIDEFGSYNQPPNAPLRRAANATGLRFG